MPADIVKEAFELTQNVRAVTVDRTAINNAIKTYNKINEVKCRPAIW